MYWRSLSQLRAPTSLAAAFDPQKNAFGFLRLFLAVAVIVGHCYPVAGLEGEPVGVLTDGRHHLGSLAVGMFFVLSGFLITRSAVRSPALGRFVWHRFLRIFPGYWVCLVVSAFVIAPVMVMSEGGDWATPIFAVKNSALRYVTANAYIFRFDQLSWWGMLSVSSSRIAGLFQANPYPGVINGSLWTLPFELLCYLGIAVLLACRLLRYRAVLLSVFLAAWSLYGLQLLNEPLFLAYFPTRGFPIFCSVVLHFSTGAVLFLYADKIPFSPLWFAGAAALALGGMANAIGGFLVPVALGYVFLCLAFKLPVGRFDTHGDFSYGAYIYAFPVQQCLAQLGFPAYGFGFFVVACILVTLGAAVFSYRWVEAPCLRLKNLQLRAGWSHRIWRGREFPSLSRLEAE